MEGFEKIITEFALSYKEDMSPDMPGPHSDEFEDSKAVEILKYAYLQVSGACAVGPCNDQRTPSPGGIAINNISHHAGVIRACFHSNVHREVKVREALPVCPAGARSATFRQHHLWQVQQSQYPGWLRSAHQPFIARESIEQGNTLAQCRGYTRNNLVRHRVPG